MAFTKFFIGAEQWSGLSKLAEEAAEVGQICGKLFGTDGSSYHWDRKGDLRERLCDEMGDVLAAIEFVVRHCFDDLGPSWRQRVVARYHLKLVTFERWHADEIRKRKG